MPTAVGVYHTTVFVDSTNVINAVLWFASDDTVAEYAISDCKHDVEVRLN